MPPHEEAHSFSNLIRRFDPAFVFIDVKKEYELNPGQVSLQYASAFRDALPRFPATIAPFGRADLHPTSITKRGTITDSASPRKPTSAKRGS